MPRRPFVTELVVPVSPLERMTGQRAAPPPKGPPRSRTLHSQTVASSAWTTRSPPMPRRPRDPSGDRPLSCSGAMRANR